MPTIHVEERVVLLSLAVYAEQDDTVRVRKRLAADHARKSRRRGRDE